MSSQKQNTTADDGAQQHRLVPVAELVFSPTNPRQQSSKEAAAELIESIRQHGILEPPIVRRLKTKRYEVVCGERRVRAAIALKLTAIWVIVRDLTSNQVRELQLVENAQREDLQPLDQAAGYAALIEHHGYDAKKIAKAVSKSIGSVYETLKLLELVPQGNRAFRDPEFGLDKGHAILIARLQPDDQRKALKLWTARHKPSVLDLRQWIQGEIHRSLDPAPWKKTDGDLVPAAGPCNNCPKRAGSGQGVETGRKNTCMDPACYEAKIAAWIKAQPASVARISDNCSGRKQPKGVFGWNQFEEVYGKKDRCQSAQRGVLVEGYRRGGVIQVCVDTECKRHRRGMYQPSPAEAAEMRKRREEADREQQIRRRMVDEILARVPNVLGQRELLIIATAFVLHNVMSVSDVCQQFDLLQGRQEPPDYDEKEEAAIEHVRSLKASDLGKLLLGWVLQDWGSATYRGPDRLLEVAQRYGLDIDKIRREVVGEKKKGKKPLSRDLQTSAK